MTPDDRHPDALLDAWLDGRLDAAEHRRVDQHLAACPRCRRQAEVLRAAVAAARGGSAAAPAPAGLAARVRAALDAEDARAEAAASSADGDPAGGGATEPPDDSRGASRRPTVVPHRRPERRRSNARWPWVAAAAAAVAALLVLAVWHRGSQTWLGPPPSADLVADAAAAYAALDRGDLPASYATDDPAAVELRWRRAGIAFPARVLDLGAMGIHLAGGGATTLAGHPAASTAYLGSDVGLLVCWMLQAKLSDLPPGAELRSQNGFEFHLYRRGGQTVVFWQEGEVLCALAGSADPETVLSLAVAKAMAPAARPAT